MDLLSRLVHVALAAPFVPVARPGTKGHRPGVPGWETGTTGVSQPGQISVSVVVREKIGPYVKWSGVIL